MQSEENMTTLNPQKLTCGPVPVPVCFEINGQLVCPSPRIRCIDTCTPSGACETLCCATFAEEPVPTLSTAILLATTLLVAVVAMWVRGTGSGK